MFDPSQLPDAAFVDDPSGVDFVQPNDLEDLWEMIQEWDAIDALAALDPQQMPTDPGESLPGFDPFGSPGIPGSETHWAESNQTPLPPLGGSIPPGGAPHAFADDEPFDISAFLPIE